MTKEDRRGKWLRPSIAERLNAHTIISKRGCLLWSGMLNYSGYGLIEINGKKQRVHRAVWECEIGSIPNGKHILHRCDVRNCIRLSHLFLGSQADNMLDAQKKKRMPFGENHRNTILTEAQVRWARKQHLLKGRAIADLARDLNINYFTVWSIVTGKRWKYVYPAF